MATASCRSFFCRSENSHLLISNESTQTIPLGPDFEILCGVRGRQGDFGYGEMIQELSFIIQDARTGLVRVVGMSILQYLIHDDLRCT